MRSTKLLFDLKDCVGRFFRDSTYLRLLVMPVCLVEIEIVQAIDEY